MALQRGFGPLSSEKNFMCVHIMDKIRVGTMPPCSKKCGRITAAGMTKDVLFEPIKGSINDEIDEAYETKYQHSPYLKPMVGSRARVATVKILLRES